MTILNLNKDKIFISPILHEKSNVILSLPPMPKEQAELIRDQLVQLSWRPHALIKSLENQAKRCKKNVLPQNFKLDDMLLAEAEELRVLLRQCQIVEPPECKMTVNYGFVPNE